MSQANDLLNAVAESTAGSATEGHLVIGRDRYITVPDDLKRVAVQFDNNIETVTFDCPRYWDNKDMSEMMIYVNYMRSDNAMGSFVCENIRVDESDPELMHFDWVITGNVTAVAGPISFLVCIKDTDVEGNEANHWNTELNTDLYVSPGMNCSTESALRKYPDIITQLLLRMERVEFISPDGWLEFTDIMRAHMSNIENPHEVNVLQLGLDQLDNTSDMDKPVSNAQRAAIDQAKAEAITAANSANTSAGNAQAAVDEHVGNFDNPHRVTAEQLGAVKQEALDELADRVETLETTGGGGGGNTNSVDISWEDYQALGDEKLTNNVTYYIPDGGSSSDEGSGDSESTLGGTGEVYMRYVNDPNDENFDWIQVQDAEGNWINSHRAYIARYWFIEGGLNKGNLSVISGGSITYGDGFTTLSGSGQSQNAPLSAQFSFDAVDLTNYDKITVKQTTTFPGTDANVSNNSITVSVKDTLGNVLTSTATGVIDGNKVNSNDIVLDVSNINEVGIVHIGFRYYNWTSDNQTYSFTCKLSQVYAE